MSCIRTSLAALLLPALAAGLILAPLTEAVAGTDAGDPPLARRAIPFGHAMGDVWQLAIARSAVSAGQHRSVERHTLAVRIRSPLPDGWLVEACYTARERGAQQMDLSVRTPANAAALDALGGGLLRFHVDRRGTASTLFNWPVIERALARTIDRLLAARVRTEGLSGPRLAAARASLDASVARTVMEPILLADWNLVYAACGVRLIPGQPESRTVRVPRADGGAPIVATDVRTLHARRASDAAAMDLYFVSEVRFGAGGVVTFGRASATVTERTTIQFTVGTGLLAGTRTRTLTLRGVETQEVVQFAETAPARTPPSQASPTLFPIAQAR